MDFERERNHFCDESAEVFIFRSHKSSIKGQSFGAGAVMAASWGTSLPGMKFKTSSKALDQKKRVNLAIWLASRYSKSVLKEEQTKLKNIVLIWKQNWSWNQLKRDWVGLHQKKFPSSPPQERERERNKGEKKNAWKRTKSYSESDSILNLAYW